MPRYYAPGTDEERRRDINHGQMRCIHSDKEDHKRGALENGTTMVYVGHLFSHGAISERTGRVDEELGTRQVIGASCIVCGYFELTSLGPPRLDESMKMFGPKDVQGASRNPDAPMIRARNR